LISWPEKIIYVDFFSGHGLLMMDKNQVKDLHLKQI